MCERETSGSLLSPLSLSIFDLPLILPHTPPATARPARGPGPSQSPGAENSMFQGRVGTLVGRVAGVRRAGQGRGETGQRRGETGALQPPRNGGTGRVLSTGARGALELSAVPSAPSKDQYTLLL